MGETTKLEMPLLQIVEFTQVFFVGRILRPRIRLFVLIEQLLEHSKGCFSPIGSLVRPPEHIHSLVMNAAPPCPRAARLKAVICFPVKVLRLSPINARQKL